MTRVRSESGAINILNVIIMLVLLIALGFAFELSAALDQQNAQTNDCSAARDATMASQNLLVAKNSDDPGLRNRDRGRQVPACQRVQRRSRGLVL